MLGLLTSAQILLFTGATDMRKGFDGLIALVMAAGENVYSGKLYVFVSGRRNHAKILGFQKGGLVLLCKRLDRGHFKIHFPEGHDRAEIDSIQLTMLLDGIDFARVRRPPHGGHYGPGLHAHVVVSRCDDIMPPYGREKALERARTSGVPHRTQHVVFDISSQR